MTSSWPQPNIRPRMIFMLSRTARADGSTPRNGTLASVPVARLGRSMMTNNSAEASGPLALRATPGGSAIMRVSSWLKPLTISLSAPLRRTIAPSGEPETVMACLNPAAMESTPTSTPTTPAMPTIVAAAEPRRCGRLNNPNLVMLVTFESQFMGPDILHSPQGVRHVQAHSHERGEDSGDETQRDGEAETGDQIARGQKKHR